MGLIFTCPAQTHSALSGIQTPHLISITTMSPPTPTPQSPWNPLTEPSWTHTVISFPDKRPISVLIAWFWFLGFQSAHFHFIPFILLPLIITMLCPFHQVVSLFSLVSLTGLLFACLEFLWVWFCLNTSFFWAKSQASLKPGSDSGHSTCSWWAPGKDRQSL